MMNTPTLTLSFNWNSTNITVSNIDVMGEGTCEPTEWTLWRAGYFSYLALYLSILFMFSLYAARRIKKGIKII